MMNIPPGEADKLSLWKYEALLHHWNAAHSTDESGDAPDAEWTQGLIDQINRDPKLHEKVNLQPSMPRP